MNSGRLLNLVLTVALVGSLVYNFILFRQSEAAIFRGADGEIVAISGLVDNIDSILIDNTFTIYEPDTGEVFVIRAGQSTLVRSLDNQNNFTEANLDSIRSGDSVFANFTSEGVNGVAKSIDILPGLIIN